MLPYGRGRTPHLFPAGEFLLNSLLRQAQSFDFALMQFGPDDIVLSGDDKVSVPRDNVVFELGLFMSQLEHDRALVVVPKTYENEKEDQDSDRPWGLEDG